PDLGRKLTLFLGSTIGNLDDAERLSFLRQLRRHLGDHDAALIGVDVRKDPGQLVAAYDDAAGVTAEFNRNVLCRLNRDLGADFDVERYEHVAVWNAAQSRIEMHLRSVGRQDVHIPGAGLRVQSEHGDAVSTEISVQ